jgi:hypothetical protein
MNMVLISSNSVERTLTEYQLVTGLCPGPLQFHYYGGVSKEAAWQIALSIFTSYNRVNESTHLLCHLKSEHETMNAAGLDKEAGQCLQCIKFSSPYFMAEASEYNNFNQVRCISRKDFSTYWILIQPITSDRQHKR